MAMTNERIGGKESLLKVAAIQMEPQIGDLKGNREKLIHKVNNAFNKGANLIVTHECGSADRKSVV